VTLGIIKEDNDHCILTKREIPKPIKEKNKKPVDQISDLLQQAKQSHLYHLLPIPKLHESVLKSSKIPGLFFMRIFHLIGSDI